MSEEGKTLFVGSQTVNIMSLGLAVVALISFVKQIFPVFFFIYFFFCTGCGHCKRMKPEFAQAATELKSDAVSH